MSNNTPKKSNKTAIVAVAVLLVLVIAAVIVYFTLRPAPRDRHPQSDSPAATVTQKDGSTSPEAGQVTIVVEVKHGDETTREFTISTEALNLRAALEQENLIAGDESEYGLFVKTVDGETADDSQQQWWCFTRGGEMLMTGVDDTEIADGDHYEIVLTTGW